MVLVVCRRCGMVVAVHSQRGTVSERTSAYECGFQGQLYMGHYIGTEFVQPIGRVTSRSAPKGVWKVV
jgi:hypothetical protein